MHHIGSEDGRVLVTVADNAGGIPGEIMDRIFDPFFTTIEPQQRELRGQVSTRYKWIPTTKMYPPDKTGG